jgi:hypothetical protein
MHIPLWPCSLDQDGLLRSCQFVGPMHRWEVFVAVAEVILPNLGSRIAVWLEKFGGGGILILQSLFRAGQAHF